MTDAEHPCPEGGVAKGMSMRHAVRGPLIVSFFILPDGSYTPIYDDGRRQWYIDEHGSRVCGVHFIPKDDAPKPHIVDDREF
jgi:hypothetical protein